MKRPKLQKTHKGKPIKRKRDKGVKPVRVEFGPQTPDEALIEACQWYILVTSANKEFFVQDALEKRGLASFCPHNVVYRFKNKFDRQKRAKKQAVARPAFPRYVFVGFRPDQILNNTGWSDILQMRHITGIIGQDKPLPVTSAAMKRLHDGFKDGVISPAYQRYMVTNAEFAEGDIVKITEGAFKDFTGRCAMLSNTARRAKIELVLFGSQQEVVIDPFDLVLEKTAKAA